MPDIVNKESVDALEWMPKLTQLAGDAQMTLSFPEKRLLEEALRYQDTAIRYKVILDTVLESGDLRLIKSCDNLLHQYSVFSDRASNTFAKVQQMLNDRIALVIKARNAFGKRAVRERVVEGVKAIPAQEEAPDFLPKHHEYHHY